MSKMESTQATALAVALTAVEQATFQKLAHGAGMLAYMPGVQPLILSPETAQQWVSQAFAGLTAGQVETVSQRLLQRAYPQSGKRFTMSLPADLDAALRHARDRLEVEDGLRASINSVAVRAMRAGLATLASDVTD